ncbi:MAG TPA: cupin domain-containing protein [Pseudonocardia sp.]|nr:cupin domain-containing protein [Pseudonocardia sp.]
MQPIARRAVVPLALVAAVLLGGCAGSDAAPPAAQTMTPPSPAAGPVQIGSGTVEGPVSLETTGPSVFSVRTVTVPPGGSTGWHRHDGTEMSIVTAGEITLVRADGCAEETLSAGDAVFVPDRQVHLARNDGTEPAEIVVTYLLAPGVQDRSDAPAACT